MPADDPGRLAVDPSVRRWFVAALICAMPLAVARADPALDARIAVIVASPSVEQAGNASALRDPAWLAQVYPPWNSGPVWFTAAGPRPSVAVALREMRAAADRGLRAGDYDVATLERRVDAAALANPARDAVARADVALTTAVLRFISDARFGRVRPGDVAPMYRAQPKDAWFVAGLRDAVATDRLVATIDSSEPALPVFGRLKSLMARYRTLATQPSATLPALERRRTKVVEGESYAGVAALYDKLVRLGDLPAGTPGPVDDRYSYDLAAAVRGFQSRHGLEPDGVLGKQTIAALNEPLETRVTQIELALERMRWLPELPPGPAIAINIPSFQLWAFADATDTRSATLSMPVIVGRAVRHETPVFIGEMRAVEFSPYWNVPPNILRNELLPRLVRDPGFLQREDMELVSTRRDGTVRTTVDDESLAALRAGELRLRQRPGPKNALGGVKFVLPNTMDIYLHDTPSQGLFARARRDFSHGCIRVNDPAGLAEFVLRGRPEWTPEAIGAAMASGQNQSVRLAGPVPVIVFYTTAIVDSGGRALFLADVYGHDRRLLEALRKVGSDTTFRGERRVHSAPLPESGVRYHFPG